MGVSEKLHFRFRFLQVQLSLNLFIDLNERDMELRAMVLFFRCLETKKMEGEMERLWI